MTYRFCIFLLLLLQWSITVPAQYVAKLKGTNQYKSKQTSEQEQAIASIKAAYQQINAMQLKKEIFRYEEAGCVEDGVVTYYRKDNAIQKITESGSIGDGSWVNEYSFQEGKLLFCYEVIVGGPAIGPVTRIERRSYISGDAIIRFMEDKRILTPDADAQTKIQTAYMLLSAYDSKAFAGVLCK